MAQTTIQTSILLSLRQNASHQKSQTESLPDLIQRINAQRGGFRFITEDSLRQQIRDQDEQHKAAPAAQDTDEDQDDSDDEEETAQERRSRIYTSRLKMIEYTRQANEQAMLTLDFLSLLMRKDQPGTANSTLSPHFKSQFPVGSLALDRLPPSRLTPAQEDRNKQIAVGWTLQNLDSASDALLGAAKRLEKDMQKEARYWEQILKVKEGGWSLCRIPREPHTIGVRYGFSEALPYFYNQGLAALRSDLQGNVRLDRGAERERKVLHVEVTRDGVSTSSQDSTKDDAEIRLEDTISAASASLFDEELFHVLTLEARSLLAHGVTLDSSTIHIPISDNPPTSLQISLSTPPPTSPHQDHISHETDSTNEATSLALALRILLTSTYRQRFERRSEPPPPISNNPAQEPKANILKPVLTYLRHAHVVDTLRADFEQYGAVLRCAGFDVSLRTVARTEEVGRISRGMGMRKKATAMEEVVTALSRPLSTILDFNISLEMLNIGNAPDGASPTSTKTLTLDVHTNLDAAPYGTSTRLSLSLTRASSTGPADSPVSGQQPSRDTTTPPLAQVTIQTPSSASNPAHGDALGGLQKSVLHALNQIVASTLAGAFPDLLYFHTIQGQAVLTRKRPPHPHIKSTKAPKETTDASTTTAKDETKDADVDSGDSDRGVDAGLLPLLQRDRFLLLRLLSAANSVSMTDEATAATPDGLQKVASWSLSGSEGFEGSDGKADGRDVEGKDVEGRTVEGGTVIAYLRRVFGLD